MKTRIQPLRLLAAVLLLAAGILAACAQAPDTSALDLEHARLDANKAAFQRFFDEVVNKGKMDFVDSLLAPDFVEHEELPSGTPAGRDGVRQFFTMIRTAFPDLHVAIDRTVAQDDFVVVLATWSGTQTGPFMGVPASGKPATWQSWDMVRIVDGKAVEHWGLTDIMSLMMGIGAMPPPPGMTP